MRGRSRRQRPLGLSARVRGQDPARTLVSKAPPLGLWSRPQGGVPGGFTLAFCPAPSGQNFLPGVAQLLFCNTHPTHLAFCS